MGAVPIGVVEQVAGRCARRCFSSQGTPCVNDEWDVVGYLGPVGPGYMKPPACRRGGRRGEKQGGHPLPWSKGVSDGWRACAAASAAAAGVVRDAPRPGAWVPGPDAGLRAALRQARVEEGGAGFRRCAHGSPT